MVALNVVGRFRHQHDLRAYRRTLTAALGQNFALRLLPSLIEIPLHGVDPDGTTRNLSESLATPQQATLIGASGSGRRLALEQLAMRWVSSGDAAAPIPALLSLARLDDGHSPPAALLSAWIQSVSQGTALQRTRSRARDRSFGAAEQLEGWRLLIYGWEELPPERRTIWRSALREAPKLWPATSLIVALPEREPPWPSYAALGIAPPTPALLSEWVQHLVPAERRTPVLATLMPGGQLHVLGERLFEVALLAWLAPRSELPTTRAELYARALATILNVQPGRLALATPVVELQLLAAYGERPSEIIPGLLEPGADGVPRFFHPQIRRYMAARQLVDERRYALLQTLEQPERAELALLIATMIDDPTPLYAALWGTGRLPAEDVLTLGRCLREHPPQHPAWVLRGIGALGLLARNGDPAQQARAHALLLDTLPALDASLEFAVTAGESTQRFLMNLFALLPADLAAPRIERLLYASATPEALAWDLADALIARPGAPDPAPPAPWHDRRALARWSYIQALHSPQRRQILNAASEPALAALADSAVTDARRLRAAQALLADPALSTRTRLAALALVEAIDHPSAFDMIERAVGDETADIQRGALAVLAGRDTGRAYAALSRVALDPDSSWETRLDAIERLGDYLADGAGILLDQCARNLELPLYLRMRAVAALGRQAAGIPYLVAIAGDADCHVGVRANATRLLGTVGQQAALDNLLRLLADRALQPLLAEAICDALGALSNPLARPAIMRLLDRAADDVTLTLAAVRALGRLGGIEAVMPLNRLLGAEALSRLRRAVPEHLLALPSEQCLDAPDLPRPIAQRLAAALATGMTPADRPTTLAEFLMHEADRVRAGVAQALAAIGGDSARAALLAALLDGDIGGAGADIIAALAETEGPNSTEALAYLLVAEEIPPLTRWLVVQHLATHPAGVEVMRRMLARTNIDTFTRGALAEALGQRGALEALPLLRQLAEDPSGDEHLRMQAVLALGLINHPTIETTLIRLIGNSGEHALLRGLAAEHLPPTLSDEGRHFLRDMLRREHPPAPIVAGALRSLGRAHDRESLPLMLRYCQDASAPVAQAAITALTDLGDESATPVLVQVTQNPNIDRAVRLQAIGALLHLGGESYRPLLREYVEQGPLPLQFQALDHLIATNVAPVELLTIFGARGHPLPLRLWLLESLQDDPHAAPFLLSILEDTDDEPDIRGFAAHVLGRTLYAPAIPALIRYAGQAGAPDGVRMHCIEALGMIGGTASWLALGRLAEDPAQPPTIHTWAFQALRRLASRDG